MEAQATRRTFLKASTGLAFAIAFSQDHASLIASAQATQSRNLGAWVDIAPDGTVTIKTPGAEMGQGSMTSLALLVAEEMDADWTKVRLEWAPTDPDVFGYRWLDGSKSMWIVGSRAVMMYYEQLRVAGAQVRRVLLDAAAERWGVPVARLSTEPGVVFDPVTGKRLTFGEIASFASVPPRMPEIHKSALKNPAQFRFIGKPTPRRDIPPKVTGEAEFSIDVHLPGMVYATARHSPTHGGEPQSWNDEQIRRMPGVLEIVRLPDGVAVVADSLPHAFAARQALQIAWKTGAHAKGFNSEEMLEQFYPKVHSDPAAKVQVLDKKGDAQLAFSRAATVIEGQYRSDLGYHAQMEPLNAVARFNDAGSIVEIWEGTQGPDVSRTNIAAALGMKPEQVTIHQCYMGGGFGRRTQGDYATEAARIARQVRKPVKLVWTREEDISNGMFRPQSFQCLKASLDDKGQVSGWSHCIVGDGDLLLHTGIKPYYYQVPNQHIELRPLSHGARLRHWRAVGHVFNVFAIESLVNEIAAMRKVDPVEFRLTAMSISPRARVVFEKVAQMSEWNKPREAGRALGVSISERSGSLAAGVAEISVDRSTGKIKVHRTWLAVDGGTIVQPDMARANVESGIVFGLSSVLHERITFKDGVVQQSNFHDYPVMRMSDMPQEMHIEFIERDAPPSGLGEIGNPWVAAAVANAFYRLTGKFLKHMPFTTDRVINALAAKT